MQLRRNDQFGQKRFSKQCQANKSELIVKLTNLQTARESHDLNMDFRSFDNDFNEFYARMYVYIIIWHYML